MSRYTGSINKKSRRLGFSILENDKEFSKGKKRTYAPGQHGNRRSRNSQYKLQLTEKQKIARMFDMNDRQLMRFVKIAMKMSGSNSQNLLNILESRIDNLVYRMGFAPTRRAARQLVTHGHVRLNGKKLSIPSYICEVGDVIAIKDVSKNLTVVNTHDATIKPIGFVTVDFANKSGTFSRLPERSELNQNIKEAYVIEYYNRLL
ncbi:MAG: 30S ribosomal protein S4 [Mycoplasmataceae bacterium]|jgi:small subunit ribosomal protein S4|nr:30S ribosomal protein S4 [Mycoplasmataceae bacterium]